MPFIHIRTFGQNLTDDQITRLQERTTELMSTRHKKVAGLTSVLVEPVTSGSWSIGSERRRTAAHLDGYITQETNSGAEKAAFISDAMAMLREVLDGSMPQATYVILHEIPADSWGYDGQTQAQRRSSPG